MGGLERGHGAGPPDVLVVVMDCVRSSDFPGGAPDAPEMPFVSRLRSQSVVFPRAISVAPWTLPSHASLFTGIYPWEHGCHGRASLRLDPRYERIAQSLAARGYRTASFSGNPIISPLYGLADGFHLSEWGEWWEQVDRVRPRPSHVHQAVPGEPAPEVPILSFRDRSGRAIKTMMTRYPATLAVTDAAARRIVDPGRRRPGAMNPWIETDLEAWLRSQPADAPTFAFVNTVDAHEPYLRDPGDASSLGEWWRDMRIPQDVLALLAPETPPPAADLARLHALYRDAIARLDRRLERIVSLYQQAGRWDRTVFVLTSDHGQAFGENGMIWHGVRTDEEMLRIPLLLRLPHDELGGQAAEGWGSPMDVPATVARAAGLPTASPSSGVPLQDLVAAERPNVLLAAGDGTEWNRPFMEMLSPRRREELNLFSVAAYQGSIKIVVDAVSDAVQGLDLSARTPVPLPAGRLEDPALAPMVSAARAAAQRLMHPTASSGVSAAVDERLRSWGYG